PRPGQHPVQVVAHVRQVDAVGQLACVVGNIGSDLGQAVASSVVDVEQGHERLVVALEDHQVVGHVGEWVVDLVGHAGTQQADRRQFFVLHQHRTHSVAFGQVVNGAEELQLTAQVDG